MTAGALAAAVLATFVVGSCSGSAESKPADGMGDDGGGVGGSIDAADAAVGDSGGTAGNPGDGSTEDAVGEACSSQSFPGELAPLDVYVLLDATASMTGTSGAGDIWSSVIVALQSVITDSASAGMGLGLTYIPNAPASGYHIPGSCAADPDCNGVGTCQSLAPQMTACSPGCETDADCGLYGPCQPVGPYTFCTGALTTSVSCDPAEYGQPVVPINTLPGNEAALIDELAAKTADGAATPTQPSLEGTLAYAKQWAEDHPAHLIHVLFITDGLPNDCTYNTIDGAALAAKSAYEGTPSVATFVLGFGDLDALSPIASSGGTGQAYAGDNGNVGAALLGVFDAIRASGACQLQIPLAASGDYDRVNVFLTPLGGGDDKLVLYVGDKSQCDAVTGGWYYDDGTKQNPTRIVLCGATCEGATPGGAGVEVTVGCNTANP